MGKFKPMACGFHSHSEFSLDGGTTIKRKVKRAEELGRIADCVTEHGNLSSIAAHHECCGKDKKIISIHGIEAYIINPLEPTMINKKGQTVPNYNHCTIHFKTKKAYEYFCQLTPIMESRAVTKYGERKPLMIWEELEAIASEIVLGSGCLGGLVQRYVAQGDLQKAKIMYEKMRSLVGQDSWYVEIFPHTLDSEWKKPGKDDKGDYVPGFFKPNECVDGQPRDKQMAPNKFLLNMAKRYGDRCLISEDAHLSVESEKVVQDCKISNGSLESWRFSVPYSMESSDFWADKLQSQLGLSDRDIEEMIDNSYHFVENFKGYKFHTNKDGWRLPTVETVFGKQYEGVSNVDLVNSFVQDVGRFPKSDNPRYQEYVDRYAAEIDLVHRNGYMDLLPYFFVVYDVVNWSRKNGIIVNLRGSGSGMYLSYVLGISVNDPIKWELPTERCLTLPRISSGELPDLDLDFSDKERVIQYLSEKYKGKMAPIAINISIKFKAAVRDIERLELGYVRQETELMCRSLPDIPNGIDSISWLNGYIDKETDTRVPGYIESDRDEARSLIDYREKNPELWEKALKVCGIVRQRGVHACAVIISDDDICNHIPVMQSKDKRFITAFDPKSVEYAGYVKFDFLGVTTLQSMKISMDSVKEHYGVDLEWGEFPATEDDYKKVIGNNKLAGLFQIKTHTMAPYVNKIQPRCADDLSNLVALIRPGCMDSDAPNPDFKGSAADYYVAVRQGKEKAHYIHPDLIPIIGPTLSVSLFQEQTMRMFRDLAGYTWGQADSVRKGIGKKIKHLIESALKDLRVALEGRQWEEDQINKLCDSIIASARYGFNKSHASSYGVVANNGIFLKSRYPLHFYLGELAVNGGDNEKLEPLVNECAHLLLPADIKKSHATEWVIEGDKLRAPLSISKGVGGRTPADLQQILTFGLDSFKVKNNEHLDDEAPNTEEGSL